ncbi:MAG: RNA polymerase subunit sigma-70 [Acidobacteria bacterium]|nr:RNA polymerase subunit sigma-70 [Acidobacteriota bacterium]
MSLVYAQLHRAAHHSMVRERPGRTLQTTALIHGTFLRLVGIGQVKWQGRRHFLTTCAQPMRRILIDFARSPGYQKPGGGAPHVNFHEAALVARQPEFDLVDLEEALNQLALVDARKGKGVKLRFFTNLSVKESAAVRKVSADTVIRDWNVANVWLLRELSGGRPDGA